MAQARQKSARRTPGRPRKRKETPAKRPGIPERLFSDRTRKAVRSWLFEVGALASCAGSIFLLVALTSYLFSVSGAMPGEVVAEAPSGNWMGPVGHLIAVLLLGFFGWCSYLPVLWFMGLSIWCWRASEEEESLEVEIPSRILFVFGVLGAFLCCTVLAGIYGGRPAGGAAGIQGAAILSGFFNTSGATLVAFAGFLVFAGFTTTRGSWHIFTVCLNTLGHVLKTLFFTTPLYAISTTARAGSGTFVRLKQITGRTAGMVKEKISKLRSARVRDKESEIEETVEIEERTPSIISRSVSAVTTAKERPSKPEIVIHTDTVRRNKKRKYVNGKSVTSFSGTPYRFPSLQLLNEAPPATRSTKESEAHFERLSDVILRKLGDFGIKGEARGVHKGPVITSYEIKPAPGVKVNKIAGLQDDLAMSLKARSVRIVAPIPGKGTVGIEVPNEKRETVYLRDVLESDAYINAQSSLTVAIGKDIYGEPVVADIATMPHLLIAGATGTGKSVCINSLLLSLLYRSSPDELGLILIDPKILELSVYEGIPHLKVPVVTNPKMARAVLEWAVNEMERRYRLLKKFGVRGIDSYNSIMRQEPDKLEEQETIDDLIETEDTDSGIDGAAPVGEVMEPLPKIVIVIDELADLMLSVGKEIEDLVARLAQKARAAGIHLIVATQRPSVDVITGLIKANFPVRISFRVSSKIDSRTILDVMGADKLLGKGDLLMMAPREVPIQRVHGAYVDDDEVTKVIQDIKNQATPQYDPAIIEACERALQEEKDGKAGDIEDDEYDVLYDEAVQFIVEQGKASTSMIQRRYKIGYNRAARIIDVMEREGIVGPSDGAKPRQVLLQSNQEL